MLFIYRLSRTEWETEPFKTLEKYCRETRCRIRIDRRHFKQYDDITLVICGVFICEQSISELQQNYRYVQETVRNQLAHAGIQLLIKPYLRVYDHLASKKMCVLTSEDPITNQQVDELSKFGMDVIEESQNAANAGSGPAAPNTSPEYFQMQQDQLQRVRTELLKIPTTWTSAVRLNVACNRAKVPWVFSVERERGARVIIFGIQIVEGEGNMVNELENVKEELCRLAIQVYKEINRC